MYNGCMMRLRYAAFLALACMVLLGAGFVLLKRSQPEKHPFAASDIYRATLTGTYLCLPHVETSGPQTLECALGLHTDEGEYYALDFSMLSAAVPDIPTGSRVSASGVVTPIERLSTDHWRKYPVTGILSVTDSFSAI